MIVYAMLLDETEQKAAEELLRIREQEYALAISGSGKVLYRYSHQDRSITLPEGAAASFGLAQRRENMPDSVLDQGLIAPESVEAYRAFYTALASGDPCGEATFRQKAGDGQYHWLKARFNNVFNGDSKPVSAIVLYEDVTSDYEKHIVTSMDRKRLMTALRTAYPIAISLNLTKNHFNVLSGGELLALKDGSEGTLDELLIATDKFVQPEYRAQSHACFSAQNLLSQFASGKDAVSLKCLCTTNLGEMRWFETRALHVANDFGQDVMGVIFSRMMDEQRDKA